MRLPSPLFKVAPVVAASLDGRAGAVAGDSTGISRDVIVPTTLGSVYVGELFRTCFSISHRHTYTLRQVHVRVEMQTQGSRSVLLDTNDLGPPFDFEPDDTRDYILHHRITDPDRNNLVCVVRYVDDDGHQQSYQTFFVLDVELPLRLDGVTAFQRDDLVFVQLFVENLMSDSVFIERVEFLARAGYTALDASAHVADEPVDAAEAGGAEAGASRGAAHPPTAASHGVLLENKEVECFVFRALPLDPLMMGHEVGTFYVSWRGAMGRTGILSSPLVTLPQRDVREFSMVVLETPAEVVLERPFRLQVEVRNRTQRTLTATLSVPVDSRLTIFPTGVSSKSLGALQPREGVTATFDLVALALGVQRVSGLVVTCAELPSVRCVFDDIHQVVVRRE